eukprot:525152-Amphidinium_carterae.1
MLNHQLTLLVVPSFLGLGNPEHVAALPIATVPIAVSVSVATSEPILWSMSAVIRAVLIAQESRKKASPSDTCPGVSTTVATEMITITIPKP